MDYEFGVMGCSLMHGWCDVCKQKGAHSIWVTGAALRRSPLYRVVCLQLSTLLPKFCFFLLRLDVVSPCWEILGRAVWNRTQRPVLFCSSCDSIEGSLLIALPVAGSGKTSCRVPETCSPPHALAGTHCRGGCPLTHIFLLLLLIHPRAPRISEQEFSRLKLQKGTILSISVFLHIEITLP